MAPIILHDTITNGEKSRRMRLALATASDQYISEGAESLASILSMLADYPTLSLAILYDCIKRADVEAPETGWANAHRIADDHHDEVMAIEGQAIVRAQGEKL